MRRAAPANGDVVWLTRKAPTLPSPGVPGEGTEARRRRGPRGLLFEAGEDGGGEEDLGGFDGVLWLAVFDEVIEFQGGLEDGGAEEAVGVVPGLALGLVERVVEAGVVPLPAVEGSAAHAEALGDGGVG